MHDKQRTHVKQQIKDKILHLAEHNIIKVRRRLANAGARSEQRVAAQGNCAKQGPKRVILTTILKKFANFLQWGSSAL